MWSSHVPAVEKLHSDLPICSGGWKSSGLSCRTKDGTSKVAFFPNLSTLRHVEIPAIHHLLSTDPPDRQFGPKWGDTSHQMNRYPQAGQ